MTESLRYGAGLMRRKTTVGYSHDTKSRSKTTKSSKEVKWSGVALEDWWRNEQFWLISGTSAHLAAVVQGLLKVIAGIGGEVKWSGVALEDWWRNEQFWLISGTSAHLAAVVQGLLKVIAGIEISFTLTSKSVGEDVDDIYADLYLVKWTSLMIPPIVIAMMNITGIVVAFCRTIYSPTPSWSKFVGGGFFSFWVLAHQYPFAKGLMGRRGKTPTIVFVWSGLIAITLSLLWSAIDPPKANKTQVVAGGFQFP